MPSGSPPRRARKAVVVAGALLAVAVVVVLATGARSRLPVVGDGADADGHRNPFADRPLLVRSDPRLVAAARQARADDDQHRAEQLERLDTVPTGTWLLPEEHPDPAEVGAFVTSVVAEAEKAESVAVLVVYGITDRDCIDGQSAGGLPDGAYLPWVRAIVTAATDGPVVVVLEPDALVSADRCGATSARLSLLRDALAALADADVPTYVDAGHPAWRDPAEVAPLLEQVGVATVDGFAVNVANYQPTATATRWAEDVSELLGGGVHYLVDTGRNGAPEPPLDDWCNPPGQALGSEPGYVDDGTRLDALLWVKPPWESDGTCHGGPDAGALWLDRTVELASASGW